MNAPRPREYWQTVPRGQALEPKPATPHGKIRVDVALERTCSVLVDLVKARIAGGRPADELAEFAIDGDTCVAKVTFAGADPVFLWWRR